MCWGWVLNYMSEKRIGLHCVCFGFALVLAGCSSNDKPPQPLSFSGPIMGTSYSLKYFPPDTLPVSATELQSGVEARLARINTLMSTYQQDSELSLLNAAPIGEWFPVSPQTWEVVALAQQISERTDGAFDISVAALVELWGFGAGERLDRVPAAEEITDLLQRVGYQHIELQARPAAVRKLADVKLDLSAIAKGYAVDYTVQYLRQAGIENFMFEVGGEIYASGMKPGGEPWRIAIESPVPERRDIQRILNLTDIAVATSGDYRNYFESDGKRYSHTIDPRTGYTIHHRLASVTVLDAATARADALATAFMVMGTERSLAYCDFHNIPALFIMKDEQGFIEQESRAYQLRYR